MVAHSRIISVALLHHHCSLESLEKLYCALKDRFAYFEIVLLNPMLESKAPNEQDLESSALDSRVNCHALQSKSRNDKKLESGLLDSRQTCSRLDLSDKDGALQGESRAHTWSCATTATPQQSPFLALKPTRSSFTPPHSY